MGLGDSEIANISGGSPTALLPWMVLGCLASVRRATRKSGGVSLEVGMAEVDGDASGVFCFERRGIKWGDDAAAAEVGGLETDAFLIGKGEQVDGKGQRDFFLMKRFERGEGGNDAEDSVIFPGVDHRIEVGT